MSTSILRRRALQRTGVLAIAGLLALSGCGDNSSGTESPSGPEGALSGDLRILVSSADASDVAFNELNDAFRAAYPDVNATLTSVPNDTYDATKNAQITAGEADVVVISFKGFRDTPDYAADSKTADVQLAEAGGYVDLSNEPYLANYNASLLENVKIGGKAYALPTGMSYGGIFYNKQIFADNGIEVPTTWAEMEQVIATLQANSVVPFGIGGKDIWPAGLVMLGMVASFYPSGDAEQALMDGLWDNSIKLDEGKPLQVLERTQKILDATAPNFAGAAYDTQPAAFANGDFAMLPDGTWNNGVIATAVGDAFEIGFFPVPGADSAADNASIYGKVELMLGVTSGTKNKDAALAWLAFFSDPVNYAKFISTAGWASAQPGVGQDEFMKSIEPYTEAFKPVWESLWIPNNKAGDAATYPFNYPALAPLGTMSAADAAKAAQEAWSAAFK
ncbi:MAG: extracellular solute-binding protein [Bifidobacteriaceae bacterium]|jgi:raffinose/stachyose/melibiose transport system substrate-binding protein|nr:extracellular solute-binding protein [Bifidobacteriaceae bacterium]